jgi:catalase
LAGADVLQILTDTNKITPAYVRFSTVNGSRGSADTVRDPRGMAVRLYTDEGNWDIGKSTTIGGRQLGAMLTEIVGNNIPVFFIQDAIKFVDLVHAVKPEPHNEIPQAQTAHDNAWDFMSLHPQSTHMQMWILSDRAIPRSYRMMQGFGGESPFGVNVGFELRWYLVHTFRLIDENGKSTFVKYHWKPHLGTHSLVWDEALKVSKLVMNVAEDQLNGQDPDFHRRDLFDAIEAKAYPKWELGVQLVKEEDEHKVRPFSYSCNGARAEPATQFDFDLLDATKIIPEDLVPVQYIGTLTLNRNPDDFFAEVEQVAFCTQHIVPGMDFTSDPLLAGRNFSYFDTQ